MANSFLTKICEHMSLCNNLQHHFVDGIRPEVKFGKEVSKISHRTNFIVYISLNFFAFFESYLS